MSMAVEELEAKGKAASRKLAVVSVKSGRIHVNG